MPAPSILSAASRNPADLRSVLSSIREVAYGWDIAADALSWGPNAVEVVGPAAADMARGLGFAGLVEPGSGRSRYDAIFSSGGRDDGDGVIYRTRYAVALAGQCMWVEDSGRWFAGTDGRPALARGVLRLERAARPEELAAAASEQSDRSSLVERVDRLLSENLPGGRTVVVLIGAIDELARLNDDFGHEATDEIIGAVQDRLRSVMRRRDHLLRYSGNRFAILLTACPVDQVEAASRRFIRAVGRSAIETARGIALARLRMGAAVAPDLASHAGVLVSAAENALACAKASRHEAALLARKGEPASGPAGQPALDREAVGSLNARRVLLALQPVVCARTRQAVFHEALMRVRRLEGDGFFANAELIPLLERRGLVRLFDHRVLELAMERLCVDPALRLSVNVSPQSLAEPEWIDAFMAATTAAPGCAPRLTVEITETATIEDPARIGRLLGRIRDQGARVAIDDFGAGHCSLRHLRAFPIDLLKLDGTFTQNLRRSTDDRFYVRTLIDLARHLGVETVAEWVDEELQATMLRDWGVTYLQGHLFGRAEIPEDAPLSLSA